MSVKRFIYFMGNVHEIGPQDTPEQWGGRTRYVLESDYAALEKSFFSSNRVIAELEAELEAVRNDCAAKIRAAYDLLAINAISIPGQPTTGEPG